MSSNQGKSLNKCDIPDSWLERIVKKRYGVAMLAAEIFCVLF